MLISLNDHGQRMNGILNRVSFLVAEIDRVLKKVSEGVETFETIFDKIQATSNMNQKEKYEQDLKKEIKKLQRLRDQIKTWISSNEIKDKKQLVENRKLIESQMERFKAIEKEMKTKAYSKEGLLQKEKMDPKEKEKLDTCDWITTTVDELSRQIEMAEAELETLQGTTKRGKKDHSKAERVAELEHHIERNKWHINRLELTLRLLENDHLPPERVSQRTQCAETVHSCFLLSLGRVHQRWCTVLHRMQPGRISSHKQHTQRENDRQD